MSVQLLKRLDVDARTAHALMREQILSYGFQEIYSSNSTGDLTTRLLASGVDGVTNNATPQIFTAASGMFSSELVGKYLCLSGTSTSNAGIHPIVSVVNTKTLLVRGGIYGTSFTTDTSVDWRIVDPTHNDGNTEFIFQGLAGTSPLWQARLFMNSTDSGLIRIEVGPAGGYAGGTRLGTGDAIGGSAPTMTLTDSGGSFSANDVGRFITITDATNTSNNGTFLVSSFTSATSIKYQNTSGVVEPLFSGTWAIPGTWTKPASVGKVIEADTSPRWFLSLKNTNIVIWTENSANTAMHRFAYIGAGQTRRPAVDVDFAVASAGTLPTCLKQVATLAPGGARIVDYQAIVFGDSSTNVFAMLPPNPYDLRRDHCEIAVGCSAAGSFEDDRGVLVGVQWISDQIPYRQFVDNGRKFLSLGNGVAVAWDGSLAG